MHRSSFWSISKIWELLFFIGLVAVPESSESVPFVPQSQCSATQDALFHQHQLSHSNVVFTQISIILLANKDLGIRSWGENLLAQRGQEAISWSSSLAGEPAREVSFHLPHLPQTRKDWETQSPSLLFSVCLSIHLPVSSMLSMANSFHLVAGSSLWSKVDFINTVGGRASQYHQISRHRTIK